MTITAILSISKITCALFYCFLIVISFYGKPLQTGYDRFLLINMLFCPVLLFLDAGTFWVESTNGPYTAIGAELFTFFLYLVQFLMLLIIGDGMIYATDQIEQTSHRKTRFILTAILVVQIIGLLSNPFTHFFYHFDSANQYVRGPGGYLPFILTALSMLIFYLFSIQHRKVLTTVNVSLFSTCVLFIIACSGLQLIFPGVNLNTLAISFSVMVMAISQSAKRNEVLRSELLEITRMDALVAQQEEELARQQTLLEQQNEILIQDKITLMQSQIKPHFIFNSLSIIRSLITEDPQRAAQSVSSFSTFLQKSLNMLDTQEVIPFHEELELVKSYLYLEQMRFPGKVNMVLDLQVEDFMLPALSVQPLVENAIKYGIRAKNDPGTVTITTHTAGTDVFITIRDDGVGFDVNGPVSGKGNGTALANIRNRLSLLCGGDMQIASTPGKGTTVTLRIPVSVEKTEKAENSDNSEKE